MEKIQIDECFSEYDEKFVSTFQEVEAELEANPDADMVDVLEANGWTLYEYAEAVQVRDTLIVSS